MSNADFTEYSAVYSISIQPELIVACTVIGRLAGADAPQRRALQRSDSVDNFIHIPYGHHSFHLPAASLQLLTSAVTQAVYGAQTGMLGLQR